MTDFLLSFPRYNLYATYDLFNKRVCLSFPRYNLYATYDLFSKRVCLILFGQALHWQRLKVAVSRNSAKLVNCKMPVKLRET